MKEEILKIKKEVQEKNKKYQFYSRNRRNKNKLYGKKRDIYRAFKNEKLINWRKTNYRAGY